MKFREVNLLRCQDGLSFVAILLTLLFMTIPIIGETGRSKFTIFEHPLLEMTQSASSALIQNREVPTGFLDPYSVLGVLSFGVYLFYILFSRYQMTNHPSMAPSSPGSGSNSPSPSSSLYDDLNPQDMKYVLDIVSQIFSNAKGSSIKKINQTRPSALDYYDDTSDLEDLANIE